MISGGWVAGRVVGCGVGWGTCVCVHPAIRSTEITARNRIKRDSFFIGITFTGSIAYPAGQNNPVQSNYRSPVFEGRFYNDDRVRAETGTFS